MENRKRIIHSFKIIMKLRVLCLPQRPHYSSSLMLTSFTITGM
ncbi:unknown [Prevotella sp. CAG:617]|nr:unknown [Prevotella sp. CAG:617]